MGVDDRTSSTTDMLQPDGFIVRGSKNHSLSSVPRDGVCAMYSSKPSRCAKYEVDRDYLNKQSPSFVESFSNSPVSDSLTGVINQKLGLTPCRVPEESR